MCLRFILLILSYSFFCQKISCQALDKFFGIEHLAGFVVLKSNDTVRGEISFKDHYDYYKNVYIKDTVNNRKEYFTPEQCEYFTFGNHEFLPKKCFHVWFFMELLISGDLKLYRFRFYNGYGDNIMFVLEKSNAEMQLVSDFRFSNFNKKVSRFLIDCPEVSAKIKNKEYRYGDLYKIVNEYNMISSTPVR
jgi:hypothetical protein